MACLCVPCVVLPWHVACSGAGRTDRRACGDGPLRWQWLLTTLAVRRFELQRLVEGTQVPSLTPGLGRAGHRTVAAVITPAVQNPGGLARLRATPNSARL